VRRRSSGLRRKERWPLPLFLVLIVLAWRWLWGVCWSPFQVACFEGVGHGDHHQHFYGWLAYAAARPAAIVPPLFANWTWPLPIPLLYADPIPIAALLFRPAARFLLINFQYFSALSLISMLISAMCGYLLGCRIVGSRLSGCALGTLLALAPPAILRLQHGHEALSLHCLLVIPITLLILRKATLWLWCLLLFVAAGVHAYFLALLVPFAILRTFSAEMRPSACWEALASQVRRQRICQRIRLQKAIQGASADLLARLLDGGCLMIALGLGMILFGYAAGGMAAAAAGDLWNANLNSLLDSQGHSSIFSPLQKIEPYQWEGFSYLGTIITVMVALSPYRVLGRDPQAGDPWQPALFPSPRLYWGMITCFLLFSFGLRIYLGSQLVVSLEHLARAFHAEVIYQTFRATGRFTWPAYYSLLLWGFCTVARSVRNHKALAAIILVGLLETHIPTMASVKSVFAQRQQEGVQWQQHAGRTTLERNLAANLLAADIFYNATGNPLLRTPEIPPFFVQAVKPEILTNYLPYLARRPWGFDQARGGNPCALASAAVQRASDQGLRPPLLLMKQRTALTCTQMELAPRVRLNDRLSLYTGRSIRTP
jgi:hypothetical protein